VTPVVGDPVTTLIIPPYVDPKFALEIVIDAACGRNGSADIVVVGPTFVTLFIRAADDRVYTAPPDTVNEYCWSADVVIVTLDELIWFVPE
jgi:hypothetical protein